MNTRKPKPTNGLLTFLNTPKGYLLAVLLMLTVAASFHADALAGWRNVLVAVAVAVLIDVGFALWQERNRIFPDGAVLTGLLVALVLSGSVAWYLVGLTSAIAVLSKHLLKIKRKPIFNPAALGLAAAILLGGTEQSWWGGLSLVPIWCIVLVIIAGMLITVRVNKVPQVFAFLGVYLGAMLLAGLLHAPAAGDGLRDPFINSALLLAFFMVTDPPTSPAKYQDQVLFGVMAALISVADYLVLGGLSYLLIGLLVANGWHAWRTWRPAPAHRVVA
jgi:Na+-translocating ferredoxin:NAD+ oxidoreductase RnfD subunit